MTYNVNKILSKDKYLKTKIIGKNKKFLENPLKMKSEKTQNTKIKTNYFETD
ncbi:hypothetical protein LEP1GSC125_0968 [Leptospira mayottensis 200901122]|uniref:Uncharacterized protein n=1 Tax=Leptospira mayottensis 200901122 TaxID=1193010 RepID=A0AA87MQY8_9LEPT|nr:hypothetical protein LEP1GSC125_0968 [Leptospira mayottensis 200901122]